MNANYTFDIVENMICSCIIKTLSQIQFIEIYLR